MSALLLLAGCATTNGLLAPSPPIPAYLDLGPQTIQRTSGITVGAPEALPYFTNQGERRLKESSSGASMYQRDLILPDSLSGSAAPRLLFVVLPDEWTAASPMPPAGVFQEAPSFRLRLYGPGQELLHEEVFNSSRLAAFADQPAAGGPGWVLTLSRPLLEICRPGQACVLELTDLHVPAWVAGRPISIVVETNPSGA